MGEGEGLRGLEITDGTEVEVIPVEEDFEGLGGRAVGRGSEEDGVEFYGSGEPGQVMSYCRPQMVCTYLRTRTEPS